MKISTVDLCNGDSERVSYTLIVALRNLVSLRFKVQQQVIHGKKNSSTQTPRFGCGSAA
jgi:hypothetical protein